MRIVPPAPAPDFVLPALNGENYDIRAARGHRIYLAMMRFASCPFCNLRVHETLEALRQDGTLAQFIAVFDSPLDNLRRHAERHDAPFAILADEGGKVHDLFGTEHSLLGVATGMIRRAPTLVRAMAKGYLPTSLQGELSRMPADFLVDSDGTIVVAHYGNDEGDHIDLRTVRAFLLGTRP